MIGKYCLKTSAVYISFSISLILLSLTVYFASATLSDPRSSAIERYVASVNAWTLTNRAPFYSSTFTIKASIASNDVSTLPFVLAPNGSPDVALLDPFSITYEPLRYGLGASSILLGVSRIPFYPNNYLDLSVIAEFSPKRLTSNFNLSSLLSGADRPMLVRKNVQFLVPSKVSGSPKQQCDVLKGILDDANNACYTFQQLVSICFQVSQTQTSGLQSWGLDASRGGIGCDALTTWKEVGTYAKLPATGATIDAPFSGPIDFSALNVTLRSSADPLLEAMALTSGSLYFGSSYKANGLLFWITFIVGLLFLGRPAIVFCSECRRDGSNLNSCGDCLWSTFVIPIQICFRGALDNNRIVRLTDDKDGVSSVDSLESAQQPLDASNDVQIEFEFSSGKPRSRSSRGTSPTN